MRSRARSSEPGAGAGDRTNPRLPPRAAALGAERLRLVPRSPFMTARPVHWHEGMFLRPHHFQAAGRFLAHEMARGDKWDLHHNWGLRSIQIDPDALANHRFVVRSLQ